MRNTVVPWFVLCRWRVISNVQGKSLGILMTIVWRRSSKKGYNTSSLVFRFYHSWTVPGEGDKRVVMVPFSALLLIAILARQGFAALPTCNAQRPDIVFIFTDDQDLHLNSLDYMQNVQKLIVDEGTTFTKHFATVSNCCPSRASLLRGQHGHNTNITLLVPSGR